MHDRCHIHSHANGHDHRLAQCERQRHRKTADPESIWERSRAGRGLSGEPDFRVAAAGRFQRAADGHINQSAEGRVEHRKHRDQRRLPYYEQLRQQRRRRSQLHHQRCLPSDRQERLGLWNADHQLQRQIKSRRGPLERRVHGNADAFRLYRQPGLRHRLDVHRRPQPRPVAI